MTQSELGALKEAARKGYATMLPAPIQFTLPRTKPRKGGE